MPHAEPTLRCSSRMRNGRALQREPPIQTGEPPAPESDSRIATPPRRHRYPPVICFACQRGSQPSNRTNLLAIVIKPGKSEERRVAQGFGSTCHSRWAPYTKKKKKRN